MSINQQFNIWEGVYKNFREASVIGKRHEGDLWFTKSTARAEELLHLADDKNFISKVVGYRESLLPFLAAVVYARKGKAEILDFGGGSGFTFVPTLYGLANNQNLKYYLIDLPPICRQGKIIYKKFPQIEFYTNLPSKRKIKQLDIVHLGSSLQYIEDWQRRLKQLSDFKPEYILFTDFYAGNVPTFATLQTYYDSKIPFWFFNLSAVLKVLSRLGYELAFKGTHRGTILGTEQGPPQNNFSKKYRLGDTCDLLLVRRKK